MYHYQLGISASEHDDFVIQSDKPISYKAVHGQKLKIIGEMNGVGFLSRRPISRCCKHLDSTPATWLFHALHSSRPHHGLPKQKLVSYVIQSLKKIAKQYKALFVKFDPSLFLSKQLIGQEKIRKPLMCKQ